MIVGKVQCKLKHCCIEDPFWQDRNYESKLGMRWFDSDHLLFKLCAMLIAFVRKLKKDKLTYVTEAVHAR